MSAGDANGGSVAVLTNVLQYDMVDGFPERKAAVDAVTPVFADFLAQMRQLGYDVFHVQMVNHRDDPEAKWRGDYLPFEKGTRGAEILPEFLDSSDIVVEKNKDSAFVGTRLDERLRERGIETLIVTGLHTEICVQTTAADGHFRGYNIVVPRDGVISVTEENRERALSWLDKYFATVSDCAAILETLKAGRDLPRKFDKAS